MNYGIYDKNTGHYKRGGRCLSSVVNLQPHDPDTELVLAVSPLSGVKDLREYQVVDQHLKRLSQEDIAKLPPWPFARKRTDITA